MSHLQGNLTTFVRCQGLGFPSFIVLTGLFPEWHATEELDWAGVYVPHGAAD